MSKIDPERLERLRKGVAENEPLVFASDAYAYIDALRSELEQSRDQVKRLREVLARVIANDPSDAIVFAIEVDKDVMEEARALAQTQEQAK